MLFGLIHDSNAPARIAADDPRLNGLNPIMRNYRARLWATELPYDKIIRKIRAVGHEDPDYTVIMKNIEGAKKQVDELPPTSIAWARAHAQWLSLTHTVSTVAGMVDSRQRDIIISRESLQALASTLDVMKNLAGEVCAEVDGKLNAVLREAGLEERISDGTRPLHDFVRTHVVPCAEAIANAIDRLDKEGKRFGNPTDPNGLARVYTVIYGPGASAHNAKIAGD